MILKKGEWFVILLASVVVFFGIFIIGLSRYQFAPQTNKLTVDNQSLDIPNDWEMRLEDDAKCHSIIAYKQGVSNSLLEEYLITENIATREWIDSVRKVGNEYNLNTPEIIVFGAMGVTNVNTLYVKTSRGNMYAIEVNLSTGLLKKVSEPQSCGDYKPLVKNVIKILQ